MNKEASKITPKIGLIGVGVMGAALAENIGKNLDGEEGLVLYDINPKVVSDFCKKNNSKAENCLLYTSPSPRDQRGSRMPSSA